MHIIAEKKMLSSVKDKKWVMLMTFFHMATATIDCISGTVNIFTSKHFF